MTIKQPSQAFTMVEVLVTITIMAAIVSGILMGIIQISRNIEKTRNYNYARKELSTFVQGFYTFSNKSLGAYFVNGLVNVNYLDSKTVGGPAYIPPTSDVWNTLYLQQTTNPAPVGTVTYNPGNFTLAYDRDAGGPANPEVMLRSVYRRDYISDAVPGTEPIFYFPHTGTLFITPTTPKFLMMEFLLRIAAPTSTNPNPINIPVKLMYRLNNNDLT